MTTKKNICIIGAGIGGLTTGLLLTKQGHTVHIFEKEKCVGGRARSFKGDDLTLDEYTSILSKTHMNLPFSEPSLDTIFEKKMLNGYTLDLGFHVIGGEVQTYLKQMLSPFNQQVNLLGSRLGYIHENGFNYPFLSKGDKFKMIPLVLRLLLARESTMKQLDQISMTETIKKYGKGKMKLVLEVFPRVITTVNNLDTISTGETFRAQKNLLQGAKPVGYPQQGLTHISDAIVQCIIQNKGTIHLNTPVSGISISNGKATGIVTEGKDQSFDAVISNTLVQDLFTIAPEKHFPSEYVNTVQSLEGTGSLCAYYSLKHVDARLLGKTFLFIQRNAGVNGNDAVGMIDFMTALPESRLSPESHYLVQSYIICTPKEAKTNVEHLREILDNQLHHLIPEYRSNLDWAIYPAIWQLDGVAKTITDIKPEIKTPVENLYLVGDCVKAPGIGINCALNSAQLVQSYIT